VLQTCFFAISGVLPREEAVQRIKDMIEKTYGAKRDIVAKTSKPSTILLPIWARSRTKNGDQHVREPPIVSLSAPAFVQKFTAAIMAGRGDALPVSAMPVDGTFPLGTAAWEKRNIADEVPVWESDLCIQSANARSLSAFGHPSAIL